MHASMVVLLATNHLSPYITIPWKNETYRHVFKNINFYRFTVGLVYYGVSLAAGDLTGNPYRDFILLSTVEFPAAAAAIFIAMRYVVYVVLKWYAFVLIFQSTWLHFCEYLHNCPSCL